MHSEQKTGLVFEQESYALNGAFFEVYKDKGPGFLEAVYHECLAIEFEMRGIPFESQRELALTYKGRTLRRIYIPDFLCYGSIVVELKAVSKLGDEHRAQVHNYLKATVMRLGFLVNFGLYPGVQHERIVR